MNVQFLLDRPWLTVLLAAIFTGILILMEHLNGGVITHHLMASKDMPGFSNWWGLLTVPLLTWVVTYFVKRRMENGIGGGVDTNQELSRITYRFVAAVLFGGLVSILWEFGAESILPFVFLSPIVLSLFIRVHFPECLLGFVLGMLYTFGGVLPILFGMVLMALSFLVFGILRRGVLLLFA